MFTDGSLQYFYSVDRLYCSGNDMPDVIHTGATVDRKIQDNLKRTIQKIYDYAKCNYFDYFVTFTFNDEFLQTSAKDYSACTSAMYQFTNWLSQTSIRSKKCKWLIVPEHHKSGRYHFHGLISAPLDLVPARSSNTGRLLHDRKGNQIYNLNDFSWGFTTATRITDHAATANYITKYLVKDLKSARTDLVVPKGKKRYWASRNLDLPYEDYLCVSKSDFEKVFLPSMRYTKTIDSEFGRFWLCEN